MTSPSSAPPASQNKYRPFRVLTRDQVIAKFQEAVPPNSSQTVMSPPIAGQFHGPWSGILRIHLNFLNLEPIQLQPATLKPYFPNPYEASVQDSQMPEPLRLKLRRYFYESRSIGCGMLDTATVYGVAVKELKLSYHNGYI